MKRCFGYVRVSTVKQGEGVSLEAQKDAIEVFAARNKIIISKWFEEKETAAKRGRPVFNRMVSELKQGSAAGVVFHKIDRSARNFADWAKIGDLADAGADIHFSTESLDFNSRGGRLTANIQAVIAADFIHNIRDEAIKGMLGRLKQGLYPFKAPLGYLDNGRGNPKTIDPVRGPLIQQLFKLYATGNYSLWSLRHEVNRLGLRNLGGQPVAKTGVEKMLRNSFYMGVISVKHGEKVYSGIHEPLVSPELFDQVKRVREGRDNKKITKHQHRYRGMFRCGYCAGAMIPELQKGRVYYRCHKKGCGTKTLREDRVDDEIIGFLMRYSLNEKQVASLRRKFEQWLDSRDDTTSAKHAEMELAKLDKRLSCLEDKLLDGLIEDHRYEKKKADIIFDRKRWAEVTKKKIKKAELARRLDNFLELIKNLYSTYYYAAAEQKREIVKFTTSNRLIFPEKVDLQPSNWMQAFENAQNLEYCDPSQDTSRTFDLIEEMLEHLNDEETQRLLDMLPQC